MTVVDEPLVAAPPRRSAPIGRRSVREALTGYGFLAPALVLLGLFVFVPLVWAALISFQRTNGFGDGTWAGLANYRELVTDPVFWRSALNTALFAVVVVPLSMGLGLALASLMNSVLPARPVFRTILILPMVVSGVATALIGVLMYDENSGVLDQLLKVLGLPAIAWQSNGAWAFVSVVFVTLWWRIGFNMLIYLAALQGLDGAVTEAARLDGANRWQRFRYMTVAMVSPSSVFLLIINVIYSFQVFDIVFVLTGGGPGNATDVLVTYAYDTGFVTRDQGYAAAIGMVLLVIVTAFAIVRWRLSRGSELER